MDKARSAAFLGLRASGGMEQMLGADWREMAGTANVAFLLAFPSLFSIINPIGGALIFYGVTKEFPTADKERAAALEMPFSLTKTAIRLTESAQG